MAAGEGGIFRGLRFKLAVFDPAKDDEYREVIKQKGGLVEKSYNWQDLYFIVSSQKLPYSDPMCVEALAKGAVLLNELWLDDSLNNGSPADTSSLLYKPPLALDGIKSAKHVHISHRGFSCQEARYIEKLVEMIGAQNVDASISSYLICCRLEAYEAAKGMNVFTVNKRWLEDVTNYEEAKGKNVFTVNKRWLEDCVTKWDILSVDGYISWPRRAKSRNYRTPVKDNNDMNSERQVSSTGLKGKSRRSPEQSSSVKRQALSTGSKRTYPPAGQHAESSCRRSLNFDWKKLSEYKGWELVVKVTIPRSNLEKAVGTNEIKSALLGSYTAMANFHGGGECIRNTFNASSFSISWVSWQVIMEQPQLVEYDDKLALANRKQFVLMVQDLYKDNHCSLPDDIAGWLSCITDVDRVADRVLKHHINMQHSIDVFASFSSMYYIVLRLKVEDPTQYSLILKSKLMKKYTPWVNRSFRWKLLNDTLYYVHPKTLELNRLRSQATGQTIICEPKDRDDDAFGVLEVIRDCFMHPAMIYKDMLLPVLLIENPKLLSDLQRVLSELGHLKNLK